MSNKVAYGIKGSYDLIEELDSGGFGTVWKAEDESKKKVVVKFPKKTMVSIDGKPVLADAQLSIATIRREIDLLEGMVNPPRSIIHFIDKSKDDLNPFLVEEYIKGKTLWDKIPSEDNGHGRNALPEKVAAEYLKQIGEGLHYLHKEAKSDGPIIHRDLKPPNIIVEDNSKRGCVILDLGVSAARVQTASTQLAGPKPSTVPAIERDENFHCQKHASPIATTLCDVYAAGRIAFFMLTGDSEVHQFVDKSTGRMRRKVKELVPSVSEKFSDLIDDILDPEHRVIQMANDKSRKYRSLVQECQLVMSSVTPDIHPYSPGGVLPKKILHDNLLQPHVICMGQRWDIENGLCEVGREHNCPTQKPEFLFAGERNTEGCARNVIVNGVDGFSYPHPLSGKMPCPDVPIKNPQIEYHHLRIWEDGGKFWVKDLSSRNKSARIVNSRWQILTGKKQALKNIERLAVGFTEKNGPVIPLSFYKE